MKNDQWISNEKEIPDPDVLPHLPGYNVLIRPVSVKGVTKGGILLPDSTTSDMAYLTTVGRVVAVGELAYIDKDKFPKGSWCKGIKLLVLFDDQIMMKVEHPKDLDPTFNLSH